MNDRGKLAAILRAVDPSGDFEAGVLAWAAKGVHSRAYDPAGSIEDLWRTADLPAEFRVRLVGKQGVLGSGELRLFACFCARQVWDTMPTSACRRAVELAERFARNVFPGPFTLIELAGACDQAKADYEFIGSLREGVEQELQAKCPHDPKRELPPEWRGAWMAINHLARRQDSARIAALCASTDGYQPLYSVAHLAAVKHPAGYWQAVKEQAEWLMANARLRWEQALAPDGHAETVTKIELAPLPEGWPEYVNKQEGGQ
jgi:hypothetical protein